MCHRPICICLLYEQAELKEVFDAKLSGAKRSSVVSAVLGNLSQEQERKLRLRG